MRKRKNVLMSDRIFDAVNTLIMIVVGILIVYPLYYVLVASFTDPTIVKKGSLLLFPKEMYFAGYERTINYSPIWKGYLNTIIYTGLGTIVSVVVTMFGAYPLSRKDMAFRTPIMLLFSFTMFFGGGLIPSYLLIKEIGLFDTMWAIILPGACSVWNMIICRSTFDANLNGELLDAASIDGCNDFGFFFRIALPLSKTLAAVMAIYYASGKWNEYFSSMIYLRDSSKHPLQLVLRGLLLQTATNDLVVDEQDAIYRQMVADQLKFCVIVVSTIPMMIFYPFVQKYFTKGVMIGSLKG